MAAFYAGKGIWIGAAADKPAASAQNKAMTYYTTDTGLVYVSDGSSWIALGGAGGGAVTFNGCRAHATSTPQSIANNTLTAVLLDTEDFDTNAYHDTGSNTSRMTAPSTGYYLITATCGFAANSTGQRQFRIVINNTDTVALHNVVNTLSSGNYEVVTALVKMTAGDYAELQVYQDSGFALALVVAAKYSPYVAITYLGS